MYSFLENWLRAFPEFQKNDLYLAGESYAGSCPCAPRPRCRGDTFAAASASYILKIFLQIGNISLHPILSWRYEGPHPNNQLPLSRAPGIYIPTLAREILAAGPSSLAGKSLHGFAVGDACIASPGTPCGPDHGPKWTELFNYGHGQVQYNDLCLYCVLKNICACIAVSLPNHHPPPIITAPYYQLIRSDQYTCMHTFRQTLDNWIQQYGYIYRDFLCILEILHIYIFIYLYVCIYYYVHYICFSPRYRRRCMSASWPDARLQRWRGGKIPRVMPRGCRVAVAR